MKKWLNNLIKIFHTCYEPLEDYRVKYVATVKLPKEDDPDEGVEYYLFGLPPDNENPTLEFQRVYKKRYGKDFSGKILYVEPWHAVLLL